MDRWAYVRAAARAEWLQLAGATAAAARTGRAEGAQADATGAPVGLRLVEALLAKRGYDVVRYPSSHVLLAGAWAALFPEMELAACDAGLSRQRQAFALAHELGHLVLHEEVAQGEPSSCCGGCGEGEIDAEAAPQDGLQGSLEVYNPRQQRELEANIFALNLLLPRPIVWRLFVEEGLDARRIAAQLEVSHTAALQALAGLLQSEPELAMSSPSGAPPERALDESQRAAATIVDRPVLVQAGPGTGKTGTLVGRVLYLVGERGVDPSRILVLTFSNRAVGELRGRLLGALGTRARALTVSTFHAFAHELLRRYSAAAGLPADFRVLDRPGLLTLLRTRLAEQAPPQLVEWISLDRPTNALAGLIEAVGRLKDDLIDAAAFECRLAEHGPVAAASSADEAVVAEEGADDVSARQAAFYHWYQGVLAGSGVVDYGDLIMRAVFLLRAHPAIRAEVQATYPQLLVDEYQDINRASGALLLELAREGSGGSMLWAVGDPRQSIYRWRGAAPEALYPGGAAQEDAPVLASLAVNYRSYGPIVRLCGGVAAALEDRPVEEGRSQWHGVRGEPDGADSRAASAAEGKGEGAPCVVLATAPDAAAELAGIAGEIGRGIATGRSAGDHAVLCATHVQAGIVASALRAYGLPVCHPVEPSDDRPVRWALSVLAIAAGDGEALLRLSEASRDAQPGGLQLTSESALLLVREWHARGEGILATLANPPAALAPDQREAARELAAFLWSLPVTRAPRGVDDAPTRGETWASLAQYLFDAPTAAARPLLAGADMQGGYPALAALLACARAYDLAPADFRAPNLPAHVRLLLEAGEGLPMVGGVDELGGQGVRVLTAHAAKGLEFPVVFVPNLAKDRFPGRGRKGQAVAPGVLAIDEAAARAADDRCLFFVALSRARDRLILSRAERYGGRAHPPSPLLALAEPAFAAEPPVRVWWPAVQADPDLAVEEVPDHGVPVAVEPPVTGPAEVDLQGLETYLQCPRRFYYGEQLGLRGAGDGQGFPHFHRVVRRALARLRDIDQGADVQAGDVPRPEVGEMQGGDPAGPGGLERALQVLAEEWAADHVPHPYEGLYLERARRMVSTAQHAATTTSGASSHDVEYAVVRPAGVVRVRVDRVDQPPDGPPVAVRYRSGRPAGDHRRDHRTALYQAALQAAHGAGSVHQEYLSTGVADQAQARASTMESRLRECDGALAGIARGEFPTRTGDHCPTCPFWLICPATG